MTRLFMALSVASLALIVIGFLADWNDWSDVPLAHAGTIPFFLGIPVGLIGLAGTLSCAAFREQRKKHRWAILVSVLCAAPATGFVLVILIH